MKLDHNNDSVTITFTAQPGAYRRALEVTGQELRASGMSAHKVLELRALGDEARAVRLVQMVIEERAECYRRIAGDENDARVRIVEDYEGQG